MKMNKAVKNISNICFSIAGVILSFSRYWDDMGRNMIFSCLKKNMKHKLDFLKPGSIENRSPRWDLRTSWPWSYIRLGLWSFHVMIKTFVQSQALNSSIFCTKQFHSKRIQISLLRALRPFVQKKTDLHTNPEPKHKCSVCRRRLTNWVFTERGIICMGVYERLKTKT